MERRSVLLRSVQVRGVFFPFFRFTITAKVRKTSTPLRALTAHTWILQEVVPMLSTWLKILMMSPATTGEVKSNWPKSLVTKMASG